MVNSNRTVVDFLHQKTLPISDFWHLMLSKHFFNSISTITHGTCTTMSLTTWNMSKIH